VPRYADRRFVKLMPEADAPYVAPAETAGLADAYATGHKKRQNILKLDYPTWVALVERWCTPDEQPLLPTRAPVVRRAESTEDDASEASGADAPPRSKKARTN
jgi:hypothetical protein